MITIDDGGQIGTLHTRHPYVGNQQMRLQGVQQMKRVLRRRGFAAQLETATGPINHQAHDDRPVKREKVEAFTDGLNPVTFRKAVPVRIPPYLDQDTRECSPVKGFKLIFNGRDMATD